MLARHKKRIFTRRIRRENFMTDKKEIMTKCKIHNYVVTGWSTKGGHKEAMQMRCSHCLLPVSLEQLTQKEWREAEGI